MESAANQNTSAPEKRPSQQQCLLVFPPSFSTAVSCQLSTSSLGKPTSLLCFSNAGKGLLSAIAPLTISGSSRGSRKSSGVSFALLCISLNGLLSQLLPCSNGMTNMPRPPLPSSPRPRSGHAHPAPHDGRYLFALGLSTMVREGAKNRPGACNSFDTGKIIINVATSPR